MKQVHWLNKAIAVLLITGISTPAFAECDFSKGIEKLPDGRFAYTLECHKAVGKLVADNKDKDEQIVALNKVIELKDLGLATQEKRADLWMNTSFKLEDRVNQMETMKSTNQWLYLGIGVVATSLAVWGAGQLRR